MEAVISKIQATSRASVKINDSYYTVEYSEERLIPAVDGIVIAEERRQLWDTVNNEVDEQVQDIIETFRKR